MTPKWPFPCTSHPSSTNDAPSPKKTPPCWFLLTSHCSKEADAPRSINMPTPVALRRVQPASIGATPEPLTRTACVSTGFDRLPSIYPPPLPLLDPAASKSHSMSAGLPALMSMQLAPGPAPAGNLRETHQRAAASPPGAIVMTASFPEAPQSSAAPRSTPVSTIGLSTTSCS